MLIFRVIHVNSLLLPSSESIVLKLVLRSAKLAGFAPRIHLAQVKFVFSDSCPPELKGRAPDGYEF